MKNFIHYTIDKYPTSNITREIAMKNEKDILARIAEQKEAMSSKQQLLADYILHNYKTAAFQNSTKLARLANVSGSTVIRFAEELGYSGFPEMQAALHRIVQQEITTVDAFFSASLPTEQPGKGGFFQPCIQSFHQAEKSLSRESIEQAARLLSKARNVYIIGFLGSSFLAEHMSYVLSRIRKNVSRINAWDNAIFHLMPENGWEQDAALVYAFPRFPAMTATLTEYFHEQGVPLICITTAYKNHISELADISIGIDIEYRTYVDHLTPVLYVSEVLAKKVSKLSPDVSVKQLERFERFTQSIRAFSSE